MSNSRKLIAGALAAAVCVLGLTATADAAGKGLAKRNPDPRSVVTGQDAPAYAGRRPSDHPKLDKKLNERADIGGTGRTRAIVVLKPGCSIDADVTKAGGKGGQKFSVISGQLVELPNGQLRKLANNPCVAAIHWDRKTGGEMNYAAVVEGARQVQQVLGYDGAGVGVATIDSGITAWHDDLTYQGNNAKVKVVNGQRVVKFVDFVNGRTSKYDDNGHGSHVAGIIAGNGYDTLGGRAGIAPAADLVSLKVLDAHGGGYISDVIAALDWVVANRVTYNIRVVNLSVGAAVTESYLTDPLTLAAKRVVDAGVVVVTAAGNIGRNATTGKIQYGAITAPGNAPWVLTVGAYSHEGTLTRSDDKMGMFSSRGPTAKDFGAKPDVVATGVGIASLSVPGSTLYLSKPTMLLKGSLAGLLGKPYLSLTGTSMAAPIVTGTVALMLQANPKLTPNLVKAIIEYTAQDMRYDPLTQGAGFLNAKGAVDLARYLRSPMRGSRYPSNALWSKSILWGNKKLTHGVIKPTGSAWAQNVAWGASTDGEGDNIVWGTACTGECDNIVWGTAEMDSDNIVWGTFSQEGDNIVWGTRDGEADNIVWGTACGGECDNIVWGTTCGGADCGNVVWGSNLAELDNIVWGTQAGEADNIVWGTSSGEADNIVWGTSTGEVDNIVWGSSSEADNITWGCSGEDTPLFDDPDMPSVFDGTIDPDGAFGTTGDLPLGDPGLLTDPPPAILTDTTLGVL